jgi:hypothetical protein
MEQLGQYLLKQDILTDADKWYREVSAKTHKQLNKMCYDSQENKLDILESKISNTSHNLDNIVVSSQLWNVNAEELV